MGFWTQAEALSFLSLPIGLQKADPGSTLQKAGLVPGPSISPSTLVLGQHQPLPWCRQAVSWGALLPWVQGSLLGRRLHLRDCPREAPASQAGPSRFLEGLCSHRILCFVLLGLRPLSCAPLMLSYSLKACPLLWSMSSASCDGPQDPQAPTSGLRTCICSLGELTAPSWVGEGEMFHPHMWIHTGFWSCLKALLKFKSSLPCFPSILCRSGSCRCLLVLSLLALDLGRVWISYFYPARWLQVLHKSLCLVSLSETPFLSAVSSCRAEVRLSDSLITERFTVMLPCVI